MKLKSITLYEDNNVENYLEGNVLCYEDGSIEGIMVGGEDMYIHGRKNQDDIRLILLTPFNYPYTYENYSGTLNRKQNNYDMVAFDNEGSFDGMCSMRLLSKKLSKEIEEAEIEELKFRIELYKEMYDAEKSPFSLSSQKEEVVKRAEEKVKK